MGQSPCHLAMGFVLNQMAGDPVVRLSFPESRFYLSAAGLRMRAAGMEAASWWGVGGTGYIASQYSGSSRSPLAGVGGGYGQKQRLIIRV